MGTNEALQHQDMFKQNMYGFMLRLLEENKNLVERLADCQRGHRTLECESRSERKHKNECCQELSDLKIKYDALKAANAILSAKLLKRKKK